MLNLHIFTPRNINSTYGNISSGTLLEAMLTSIMTRTANLRDLLENIFDCSSPSHAGQFPLKTHHYFSSPKLVLLQLATEVK